MNDKMKNKLMHSETKLTFYSTKCDDLNKLLKAQEKEHDSCNNKKQQRLTKQYVVDAQHQQQQQRNAQMIEMYRLEQEIKDLTLLLNTNKEYYTKYKATHDMLEMKKKEMEDMRSELISELKDKTIKMAVTSNECQSLQTQMNVLEDERQRYIDIIDECRRESINDKTQVKKLNMIIEEKNNIINMLNEDMNMWLQYYDNEKQEHAITMNELHVLERRVHQSQQV
jgi:chromosome segregation ATPase